MHNLRYAARLGALDHLVGPIYWVHIIVRSFERFYDFMAFVANRKNGACGVSINVWDLRKCLLAQNGARCNACH